MCCYFCRLADYFIVRKRKIRVSHLYIRNESSIYWYKRGFNIRAFAAWTITIVWLIRMGSFWQTCGHHTDACYSRLHQICDGRIRFGTQRVGLSILLGGLHQYLRRRSDLCLDLQDLAAVSAPVPACVQAYLTFIHVVTVWARLTPTQMMLTRC